MTLPEKRPVEDSAEVETKKQNTASYVKGVAAIKPEYLAPVSESATAIEYNDDEAEGGGRDAEETDQRGNGRGNRKKNKGQNHKRKLKQKKDTIKLCASLIDPEDESVVCSAGGAENCKFHHDVVSYLESKPEDIEGVCPVFEAIGYCPSGIKCRWLKSHYNKETSKLIKDLEKFEVAKKTNCEVNVIDKNNKFDMQKKKYDYTISAPVIKYLDSSVKNEKNENQEERKDNEADYVEAPFKIAEKKKLHLRNAKIVSPLTTVGNLPYRRLMKTLGADVTYSEMALSVPLIQGHNPEWALPKAHISEYPGFGVQIASSRHWPAAKAAEAIYRNTNHVSELNLNCGCPIDLLYKQGQGSALMDQPSKLLRILHGMNASSGDIPVTVKIRTGVREGKNTAKTLVRRVLQEGNTAAITLHGRSRQQRYSREADWDYIAEVGSVVKEWNENQKEDKDATDIQPVYFVGNGDVYSHEDWYNHVNTDGIDSVMVARGALIKPWIFEEVEAQQYLDKSSSERLDMLGKFAKYAVEHWGSDEYGVGMARRYMCEFLGFTHRYIPVGIMERLPPKLNERPPKWVGRNEMETMLASTDYKDWIKITEMFLGKASEDFQFIPKHKSNAYETN
ncbi:tRNA-dihydrouridine(47) synthase [NAD(P)(+)] [Candida tropicalis]